MPMKIASKTKPRLVVYLSAEELLLAKQLASAMGLRTPHQWLGSVMRQLFAKAK